MGIMHGRQAGKQDQGPAARNLNQLFYHLGRCSAKLFGAGQRKIAIGDKQQGALPVIKRGGQFQGLRLRRQAQPFKKKIEFISGGKSR